MYFGCIRELTLLVKLQVNLTENRQEKFVYPCKPVWHAQADPDRYFTQSPQCWFAQIKGKSS